MDAPRHRLFVEAPLEPGRGIALLPEQAHYLGTVLRLGPGARVALFNGRDGEWRAEISRIGRGRGEVVPLALLRPQAAEADLWLCFAPVKRARIDLIAEKASELGATLLQPVLTRRTQVERVKLERLRGVATEAAEQCERLAVPEVRPPVALGALLADWPAERRLVLCDEAGTAPPAAAVLASEPPGRPIAVLIGPEGGFHADELALVRRLPAALAVSLGPRILRADTAVTAALTLVQALLGDWRAAQPPPR